MLQRKQSNVGRNCWHSVAGLGGLRDDVMAFGGVFNERSWNKIVPLYQKAFKNNGKYNLKKKPLFHFEFV